MTPQLCVRRGALRSGRGERLSRHSAELIQDGVLQVGGKPLGPRRRSPAKSEAKLGPRFGTPFGKFHERAGEQFKRAQIGCGIAGGLGPRRTRLRLGVRLRNRIIRKLAGAHASRGRLGRAVGIKRLEPARMRLPSFSRWMKRPATPRAASPAAVPSRESRVTRGVHRSLRAYL
jgi:hypothetical protein